MGAFGAVIGVIFGVIWTGAAASMGAPPFFLFFGVLFIIVGIVQAVYNFKNATGENRFSSFDITEDGEEPDPWTPGSGRRRARRRPPPAAGPGSAPTAAPGWGRTSPTAPSAAESCRISNNNIHILLGG